jgi:hypothetical protein
MSGVTREIPKKIFRELIESGTVPPRKREGFTEKPIPVSLARKIIEEALGMPESRAENRFGGTGKQLELLADGRIAFHQSFEESLGKMSEHTDFFANLRVAIDAYLAQ